MIGAKAEASVAQVVEGLGAVLSPKGARGIDPRSRLNVEWTMVRENTVGIRFSKGHGNGPKNDLEPSPDIDIRHKI